MKYPRGNTFEDKVHRNEIIEDEYNIGSDARCRMYKNENTGSLHFLEASEEYRILMKLKYA